MGSGVELPDPARDEDYTDEELSPVWDAPAWIERVLGRAPADMDLHRPLLDLAGHRALITGAAGSIGQALAPVLRLYCDVWETDEAEMDVRDPDRVREVLREVNPAVIFHLAGAKHAPAGEEDPWYALQVNSAGTKNLLEAARVHSPAARVVTASTCKACNPETAYGASKLLAERMTLNAGESVARFYNVAETQGNVFDIWGQIGADDPIPWTDCHRYFMSVAEAVGLLVWAAVLPAGRYTFTPVRLRWMLDVAEALFPARRKVEIPARRGDRRVEPRVGDHEVVETVRAHPGLGRVVSPHD